MDNKKAEDTFISGVFGLVKDELKYLKNVQDSTVDKDLLIKACEASARIKLSALRATCEIIQRPHNNALLIKQKEENTNQG